MQFGFVNMHDYLDLLCFYIYYTSILIVCNLWFLLFILYMILDRHSRLLIPIYFVRHRNVPLFTLSFHTKESLKARYITQAIRVCFVSSLKRQ